MILLTAFEPFGGEDTNSSLDTLRALPEAPDVCRAVLPVTFSGSVPALQAAIRRVRPDAVLCLGQAGGAECVRVERVGLNLDDARMADNAGDIPRDRPIDQMGPAAYFATLPVRRMADAINAASTRSWRWSRRKRYTQKQAKRALRVKQLAGPCCFIWRTPPPGPA